MEYNKLSKAAFIKFIIKTKTPLLIGKGESNNTDIDLILDRDGKPYIPGTSIAGAFRTHLEDILYDNIDDINLLFGKDNQSLLCINNGVIKSKEFTIKRRNGIEINEFIKTTKNSSKYDYEILESGVNFEITLELLLRKNQLHSYNNIKDILSVLFSELKNEKIRLGAKTRRGLGNISIDGDVSIYLLELDKKDDIERFINFSWDKMDEDIFLKKGRNLINNKVLINNPIRRLNVELSVKNTLCIRDYLTSSIINRSNNEVKYLDYEQLRDSDNNFIIPGTTWAGAIRHRILSILFDLGKEDKKYIVDELFGFTNKNNKNKASRVYFKESVDKNESKYLTTRRVKIDRFTGGNVEGGLFDGNVAVGGKVNLTIDIKNSHDYEIGLLLLAIKDITNGFLAIGGETAIGRGIFEKISNITLDGVEIKEEIYLKALAEKLL